MGIYRGCRLVLCFWATLNIIGQNTGAQPQGYEQFNTADPSLHSSLFYYHQSEYPRDCQEVHDQCSSTVSDGVYAIKPDGLRDAFEVFCDNTPHLGGWMVIQRRLFNGTVDFNRNWESYKHGFGFLSHEFWIGNEKLSYVTNQKSYELLIEVTTSYGVTFNQSYNNFRISDGFSSYSLLSAVHQSDLNQPLSWCPDNMIYGNCTCGQRQCGDPTHCRNTCVGDLTEGCVCPEGYYMQEEHCVPEHQCNCYLSDEHKLLSENETYIDDSCTRATVCTDGELISSDRYQCSPNAVCAQKDGVRKCYCNSGYTGDGESCSFREVGTDCQDAYNAGNTDDGVYLIRPTNWQEDPFEVYCNMTPNGEGWTVFQRRIDGTVDFDLDWVNYTQGFGSLDHEHWLGNEKLYSLTNQRNYEIRIDMVFKDDTPYYGVYDSFRINNGDDKYRLSSVGAYSGTAPYGSGNYGLNWNRNHRFTTRDQDNDVWGIKNCASEYFRGGWWFKQCTYTALNGMYTAGDCSDTSIVWKWDTCNTYNIKYTEMKIRPI